MSTDTKEEVFTAEDVVVKARPAFKRIAEIYADKRPNLSKVFSSYEGLDDSAFFNKMIQFMTDNDVLPIQGVKILPFKESPGGIGGLASEVASEVADTVDTLSPQFASEWAGRLSKLDLSKKADLDTAKSILSGFEPIGAPAQPLVSWFKDNVTKLDPKVQAELISQIPPTVAFGLIGAVPAAGVTAKLLKVAGQAVGQMGVAGVGQGEKRKYDANDLLIQAGLGAAGEFIGLLPSALQSLSRWFSGIPDEILTAYAKNIAMANPETVMGRGVTDLSAARQELIRRFAKNEISQSEFLSSDNQLLKSEIARFERELLDPNTVSAAVKNIKDVFSRPHLDMSVFTGTPEGLSISKDAMAIALRNVLRKPPGVGFVKELGIIGPTANKILSWLGGWVSRAGARAGENIGTSLKGAGVIPGGVATNVRSIENLSGQKQPSKSIMKSGVEALGSRAEKLGDILNSIKKPEVSEEKKPVTKISEALIPTINSQEDYDKLPIGSEFYDAEGNRRKKR